MVRISQFTGADTAARHKFGSSVSISENMAIVGSRGVGVNGNLNAGAAYIFTRAEDGTWRQSAQLSAADAARNHYFGASVAISGNTAIVGAHRASDDENWQTGAAYIFTRAEDGAWRQSAKLTAPDAVIGTKFGISVSISGDTALVGSSDPDDESLSSAYLFTRAEDGTWPLAAQLRADDGASQDYFGESVSISGDVAVVGAYGDRHAGFRSGSAYVFTRSEDGSWPQRAKLTAADADGIADFGKAVSISGDTVIVGASIASNSFDYEGSVYIFRRAADGSWPQTTKLTAPDPKRDSFGISVAISADTAW